MGKSLLEVRSIRAAMEGVEILRDVSFELEPGECLAVVGSNGAGKSILAEMIAGNRKPDQGKILLNGRELPLGSFEEIRKCGVAALYQDMNLVEDISVAENVMLGQLPKKSLGRIDWDRVYGETEKILKDFGCDIRPRQRVCELEYTQKRIVELAKVVFRGSHILILDEPYLGMTQKEQGVLKGAFEKMRKKGVGIIIISHFLNNVKNFCDSAIFIQKGMGSEKLPVKSLTNENLMLYFTGRYQDKIYPKLDLELGDTLLEVRSISSGYLSNISFSLRQHEILGICGNASSGKHHLMRALAGAEKILQGEVRIKNRAAQIDSVKEAFRAGIGYMPEVGDGLEDLFVEMSIAENISVADLSKERYCLPYAYEVANDQAEKMCRNLCVSGYRGLETPVQNLSGGNRQKVRLGRRLFTESRILLLEEPTRGIDVAAKLDFYNYLCDFILGKTGIIILSSDMSEMIGLCDRILVLDGGRLRAEINRQEIEKLSSYV